MYSVENYGVVGKYGVVGIYVNVFHNRAGHTTEPDTAYYIVMLLEVEAIPNSSNIDILLKFKILDN